MGLVDGGFSGFLSLCTLTDSKHFEIKRPPTHSARRPVLGLIDSTGASLASFLYACMNTLKSKAHESPLSSEMPGLYSHPADRAARLTWKNASKIL